MNCYWISKQTKQHLNDHSLMIHWGHILMNVFIPVNDRRVVVFWQKIPVLKFWGSTTRLFPSQRPRIQRKTQRVNFTGRWESGFREIVRFIQRLTSGFSAAAVTRSKWTVFLWIESSINSKRHKSKIAPHRMWALCQAQPGPALEAISTPPASRSAGAPTLFFNRPKFRLDFESIKLSSLAFVVFYALHNPVAPF